MTEKHFKKYSACFELIEMEIKTLIFNHTPVRLNKLKTQVTESLCWRDCGARGNSSIASGNTKLHNHFVNQIGSMSENWESFCLKTQLYHFSAYTQWRLHSATRNFATLCLLVLRHLYWSVPGVLTGYAFDCSHQDHHLCIFTIFPFKRALPTFHHSLSFPLSYCLFPLLLSTLPLSCCFHSWRPVFPFPFIWSFSLIIIINLCLHIVTWHFSFSLLF